MNTQIGLIDVDGVLANFHDAFLDLLNTPKVIGDWKRFPSAAGPLVWDWPSEMFPAEEVKAAWAKVERNPGFWGRLETFPGTIDFLHSLKRAEQSGGVQPYFVTNRLPAIAAAATNAWLDINGYPYPNVIAVSKSGTKHLIAEAVGANFIVDDYWKNFEGLGANVRKYLVDRPWNQGYSAPGVVRIKDPFAALTIELEGATAPRLEVAA